MRTIRYEPRWWKDPVIWWIAVLLVAYLLLILKLKRIL